jgi:hypothetical protein
MQELRAENTAAIQAARVAGGPGCRESGGYDLITVPKVRSRPANGSMNIMNEDRSAGCRCTCRFRLELPRCYCTEREEGSTKVTFNTLMPTKGPGTAEEEDPIL